VSGPEATMTGMIPRSFHRIAPSLSTRRSNPRMLMPFIRTAAFQIMPRPQWMTCSAVNGSQRRNLISPRMRSRTTEASAFRNRVLKVAPGWCWHRGLIGVKGTPAGRGRVPQVVE
jgi:hypothetical protein